MKRKLFTIIGGLLLASSSMFAGWGVSVGVGSGYYGPRGGVVIASGPGYVRPHYWTPGPYVAAVSPAPYAVVPPPPAPYVETYVGPPPFYGAVWVPGRWYYGPRGRYWVRGYWRHRW
jgi:hypothetical protein